MKLPLTVEDCDLIDADVINIGYTWQETDAARIAAAVNHADVLAEALRPLVRTITELAEVPTHEIIHSYEHARAVLAAYDAAKEAQP